MDFLGQTIPIPASCRRVKLDIGMGMHNVQSINWLKHEKDLFVFMFEPNTDCVQSCMAHMQQIQGAMEAGRNAICLLPLAIANVEGMEERPFYCMALDGGTSSLLRPVDRRLGPIKEVRQAACVSLSSFFESFPWGRFPVIDYVKIDVQGADLDVLRSAGSWLADRVIYVTVEAESTDYEGCEGNTEGAIEEYMRGQGFDRIRHANTSDPTFVNRRFKGEAAGIYIYQRT